MHRIASPSSLRVQPLATAGMARLAMKPPMFPSTSTRSPSLSSITIAHSDSSISISSTPATSNTDASSVSAPMNSEDVFRAAAEAGASAALAGDQSNRVKRVRKSLLASYNENVLSGTARRKSMDKANGSTATGKALVAGAQAIGTDSGVLGESIQVSDLEWRISHGECLSPRGDQTETKNPAGGVDAVKRRRSARLELVTKAKDVFADVGSSAASAVGVLGKRTLDIMEVRSKGTRNVFGGLGAGRSGSLRPRGIEKHGVEQIGEPLMKKAKFSAASTSGAELPAVGTNAVLPSRPKRKIWLSHGLYAGQDPEFKAHLTERKNKAQAISRRSGGKRPFLRLPIFAGQRLLENDRNFELPFDVFSPLLTRQPKPEEWRKITKNIFVGEAAEIWKKNKINGVSKCVCTPENGCDEDCQNRHMFYECDENNCAVGSERCTNRSFRDLKDRCKAGGKYNVGVEVFKTEDRGYGVRANRSFEPNQIILEYAGEIITQEECERRMKKEYKKKECFYLMVFDQNMIIDATRGSIARFVNHSCEPNCKMVKWTVSGKPRMALFAGENGVMTGEELCYDYNFDPYSIKNVQECRCASANCRGVLGPKQPFAKEQKKEIIKPLARQAKRKLKQFLSDGKEASSASSRMKRRKLTTPRSTKKSFITPARSTSKTTAGGATGRIALPGRRKQQMNYNVTKTRSAPSFISGARAARLQSKKKTVLKRAVKSARTRNSVDDSTISVRSSPRKKVKTFKAAELSQAVKVARKESSVKTAVFRVNRGVVGGAKGSKAEVMVGARGGGE